MRVSYPIVRVSYPIVYHVKVNVAGTVPVWQPPEINRFTLPAYLHLKKKKKNVRRHLLQLNFLSFNVNVKNAYTCTGFYQQHT